MEVTAQQLWINLNRLSRHETKCEPNTFCKITKPAAPLANDRIKVAIDASYGAGEFKDKTIDDTWMVMPVVNTTELVPVITNSKHV